MFVLIQTTGENLSVSDSWNGEGGADAVANKIWGMWNHLTTEIERSSRYNLREGQNQYAHPSVFLKETDVYRFRTI